MTDHFAALNQPRRPWLDVEALKEAFYRASAIWHPDVAGTGDAARFSGINAAYSTLRDMVGRLRHLLELEAPEQLGRTQVVPSEFADLFMQLGAFRQALQIFHKKEAAASPGLGRALLAEERTDLWKRSIELDGHLRQAYGDLFAPLYTLDAEWQSRPPDAAERLAGLYQRFSYLSKWRAQLGESVFQFLPEA